MLRLEPSGPLVQRIQLARADSQRKAEDRQWQRLGLPGRSFSFRVDSSNIYILEGAQSVGALEAKKNKHTGEVDHYAGKVRMAPASQCPDGQGRAYIEAKNISENSIKIRIEEPSKDSKTGQLFCGSILLSPMMWKLIGPQIVFIPEAN